MHQKFKKKKNRCISQLLVPDPPTRNPHLNRCISQLPNGSFVYALNQSPIRTSIHASRLGSSMCMHICVPFRTTDPVHGTSEVSRSTVPIRLQSLQNLDNSSFGFFIPVSSNSSDWIPVCQDVQTSPKHAYNQREALGNEQSGKFVLHSLTAQLVVAQHKKHRCLQTVPGTRFLRSAGFYYGPLRLIAPTIRGREKKAVKQKMQGISIVRSRAGCLVPVGELDTLLNGRLELALEVFQPLLLEVVELTQTKHFLHSILAEPYL